MRTPVPRHTVGPTQTVRRLLIAVALLVGAVSAPSTASASAPHAGLATPHLLVSGLAGGSGSTIGPDGALYIPENAAGRIARVDRRTGAVSVFASGLPPLNPAVGIGGVMDVAFLKGRAYALVTLVGTDTGGSNTVGIYRIDSPTTSSVVADIGAFALANPPEPAFFVPTGVQYAMQPYRGGFLVSDGHHNRVLRVTLDGQISVFRAFDNIVPTGLALRGRTVYMAEAGPVPHAPADGKVVSFGPRSSAPKLVASGAPLLVDVEFGPGRTLYALAQGDYSGDPEGSPALPDTGTLVRAKGKSLVKVAEGLDRPTSMEIVGRTAYVVTLTGEIWTIRLASGHHHHH
ncbi:MAG: ScyD/ScyE family protein [Pedococcus sp.]